MRHSLVAVAILLVAGMRANADEPMSIFAKEHIDNGNHPICKIFEMEDKIVTCMKFSRDGNILIMGGYDRIRIRRSHSKLESVSWQMDRVYDIDISADDSTVAIVGPFGPTVVRSLSAPDYRVIYEGKPVFKNGHFFGGSSVHFSVDGKSIFEAHIGDDGGPSRLECVSLATSKAVIRKPMNSLSFHNDLVSFSDDVKKAVSKSGNGTTNIVHVWDLSSGIESEIHFSEVVVDSSVLSPDGNLIAAPLKNKVEIFSLKDNRSFAIINGGPSQLAFSGDGKRLAIGSSIQNDANNISLYELDTKRSTVIVDHLPEVIEAIAITRDGKKIAYKVKGADEEVLCDVP